MKKFSLLAIIFVLLSCSKDDKTPPKTQSELIIGKWEHTTDKIVQANGTVIEGPYGGNSAGCNKDFVTFSNGSYTSGDYQNVGGNCELTQSNLTWNIANNKITLGASTFEIEVLNETDFGYKTPSGSQTFFFKKVK